MGREKEQLIKLVNAGFKAASVPHDAADAIKKVADKAQEAAKTSLKKKA